MHRSRVAYFTIDVDDLDAAVRFWSAALGADTEPGGPSSRHIYRKLRLADADIRILLQRTGDEKVSKNRVHLDFMVGPEYEAEALRIASLGATRVEKLNEYGLNWIVMHDPEGNEICICDA